MRHRGLNAERELGVFPGGMWAKTGGWHDQAYVLEKALPIVSSHCCIANHPQTQQLNATSVCHLTPHLWARDLRAAGWHWLHHLSVQRSPSAI